jgi:hypothetical protein
MIAWFVIQIRCGNIGNRIGQSERTQTNFIERRCSAKNKSPQFLTEDFLLKTYFFRRDGGIADGDPVEGVTRDKQSLPLRYSSFYFSVYVSRAYNTSK